MPVARRGGAPQIPRMGYSADRTSAGQRLATVLQLAGGRGWVGGHRLLGEEAPLGPRVHDEVVVAHRGVADGELEDAVEERALGCESDGG